MADFSFSFDSDNPFAEPQTAPKSAPTAADKSDATNDEPVNTTPENTDAPVASATTTSAPETDELLLDPLDFSFDEGASINDSLPTRNTTDSQTAPRQKTPGEAALAEFEFGVPEETSVEETFFEQVTAEDTAPESIVSATPAPEEVQPEVESVENSDDLFFETTTEPAKDSARDLDEFNALNFDLYSSPDETLAGTADEVESATEANSPAPEATNAISSAFLLDLDNFDSEVEPTPETASEDTPLDDFSPIEESPIATEIGVPDAVAAGASFDVVAEDTATEVEQSDDIEDDVETDARPRRVKTALSVAVLGASGIGKNHARWFHRNGCRIVGFLGTSGDSTAQTEADLIADFPFDGTAYTDLGELLAQEKPDIVCVATPPALHFGHVLQSLEAGAHVLCEKPLVYAPTRKFRENRDGAKELVKVAAKKNLVLGTQLQYGAATPILCKLAGLSATDVGDFAMELETLNPNSSRDPRELWIDIGPHPISVAQMLAGPQAKLAEETIRFEPYQDEEKTEVLARFGINCADGRLLMVRAVVRALRASERQPRRRFSFNGHSVTYAPIVGAKGNFQAQFVAPDGYASVYADPVDYLVGDFVRACRDGNPPLISGDFGRENLEWMLKVAGEK